MTFIRHVSRESRAVHPGHDSGKEAKVFGGEPTLAGYIQNERPVGSRHLPWQEKVVTCSARRLLPRLQRWKLRAFKSGYWTTVDVAFGHA